MVEVWAMAPTPNSMYMAHQYRLLDCKRGFSANKSRKMVMQMFTISVVFFIFCCKFYTFFYVCMLGHCCAECRMMQRVLQRYGRLPAMFGNPFAVHPQSVRSQFRGCTWVYCGVFATHFVVFATHLWNVRNIVANCSPRCCNPFATLLQSVRHVSAICKQRIRIRSPRCCNPSAAHSHLISSVVAICSQAKSLNLLCV